MKKIFAVLLLIILIVTLPAVISPEQFTSQELRKTSTSSFVKLRQGIIEYEQSGKGDTAVLFIHGFSIPQSMWDSQITFLNNRGFRTVRYNQFGRGCSDYPKGKYNREEFTQSAIELLDSLKVDHGIIVGHSFGAALASEIAIDQPNRVVKLIFLDPMLDKIKGVSGATMARMPLIGGWLTRVFVSGGVEKRGKDLLAQAGVSFPNRPFDDLKNQRKTRGYHRAVHAMFCSDALENYESIYKQVGQLNIPVSILYGEPELITPNNDMNTILNAIPSAKKQFLPKTCHLVHLHSSEKVNQEILAFIRE